MPQDDTTKLVPNFRLSRRQMLLGSAAVIGAGAMTRSFAETAPEASGMPWHRDEKFGPGEPGRDYTPVYAPNGATLDYTLVDGVKVFQLVAEEIVHEVCSGLVVNCWGYNGRFPGPVIEGVEGDRVRIYVTNHLKVDTSVHWHGMILPNGMDGVGNMTQPNIKPGETFVYEFSLPFPGMFMYHSHVDTMTQEGMGLIGALVVHPRNPVRRPDRDFVLMLHEWAVEPGTSTPNPFEMTDFNVLTFNGKSSPGTHPLVTQLGDRVRIRIGNLSAMDHHPIHLHGHVFKITETDGGPIPESAQWPETTVLVGVGQTRTIELIANNPGDWMLHCHMTHHTMNQMGHDFPNMIGMDPGDIDEKIRKLVPGYMTMGTQGMEEMASMRMHMPENTVSMLGHDGPWGPTTMGGMATIFKVRESVSGFDDPGHYDFPKGSVARVARADELKRDGVKPPTRS